MPERSWLIVSLPTLLIFRYHLPLKCILPRGRQRDVVYLGWPSDHWPIMSTFMRNRQAEKAENAGVHCAGSFMGLCALRMCLNEHEAQTQLSLLSPRVSFQGPFPPIFPWHTPDSWENTRISYVPFSILFPPDLLASLCHVRENISVQSRFDLLYLIGFKILNLRN
jgi:hypothetical protein